MRKKIETDDELEKNKNKKTANDDSKSNGKKESSNERKTKVVKNKTNEKDINIEAKKEIVRKPREKKVIDNDIKDDIRIDLNESSKLEKKLYKDKTNDEIEIISKSIEFSLVEVIFIVLITGIAVSIASGVIVYNNYDKLNVKVVSNNSNVELKEFIDNYEKLSNNYVEEIDKNKLIESAISGMYNYVGDEYTMYINNNDTEDLEEQLKGEYTGIGVEISTEFNTDGKTTYVRINRVFENSPAEKAGLKPNDIILKVDDTLIKEGTEIVNLIKKGNKDSYVITYKRDGKESTSTIKREKVIINSIESKEYDNVGYIKINTFSAKTESQIKEKLDKFGKNINSLVIDVRDNTGGYLDTAYEVSDLFIEKGKNIYQIKDRNEKTTEYKAKAGIYRKFNKIVVLMNESSASASEILALALKESANATLIGTKSYGKGTVQETSTLSSGSMVKYTKAYWLSPNGNSINKLGIKPDIEVNNANKQLNKALEAAK